MVNEKVENVMSLAFELARIREVHGSQSGAYLSEVKDLRAEVTRLAAQAARTDGAISRDSFSGEQLRAAYEVSTARGYSPEGSEAGNPSTPAAGNFAEWARVWHDTASTIATIAGGNPNLDPRGMIESVQVAQSAPLAQQARKYPAMTATQKSHPKLPRQAAWGVIWDTGFDPNDGHRQLACVSVGEPGTWAEGSKVRLFTEGQMRAYVDADRAAAQVDQPAGRVIPADGEVRG